jgi:hypothetical protein
MEFRETIDGQWISKQLTNPDGKPWRIVTKSGMVFEVKNPMSFPCPETIKTVQYEDGIVPYFEAEPLLSWGTGPVRKGYYFHWFDNEWYEYYEDDDPSLYFFHELKKLETERERRESIREMDELKSEMHELKDRVSKLERLVEQLSRENVTVIKK